MRAAGARRGPVAAAARRVGRAKMVRGRGGDAPVGALDVICEIGARGRRGARSSAAAHQQELQRERMRTRAGGSAVAALHGYC